MAIADRPILQLIELTTTMETTAVAAPGRKLTPKLLIMPRMPSVPRLSLFMTLPGSVAIEIADWKFEEMADADLA